MMVINKISKEARSLLILHLIKTFGRNIGKIFLAIFIFKKSSIQTVGEFYTIYYFFGSGMMFYVCGWLSRFLSLRTLMRIGLLSFILFYLIIIFLKDQCLGHIPALAILFSVSLGFYWLPYNMMWYDTTNQTNRRYYVGLNEIIISSMELIIPVVFGYIIVANITRWNYFPVFVCCIVFFITALILTVFIIPHRTYRFKQLLVRNYLKQLTSSDVLKYDFGASVIRGLTFKGVFEILFSLLLFSCVGNEFDYGKYFSVFAFTGIISTYIVSHYVDSRKWGHLSTMLSVFIIISTLLIYFSKEYTFLIIIWSFIYFTAIPVVAIAQHTQGLNASEYITKNRVSYMILRENAMALGRVVGFGALWLLPNVFHSQTILYFFIMLLSLTLILFSRFSSHLSSFVHSK